jgi:hypothetical protein
MAILEIGEEETNYTQTKFAWHIEDLYEYGEAPQMYLYPN